MFLFDGSWQPLLALGDPSLGLSVGVFGLRGAEDARLGSELRRRGLGQSVSGAASSSVVTVAERVAGARRS